MGLLKKALEKAKQTGLVEEEENAVQQQAELQEYVEGVWHWLRATLDEGCDRYQHEGKDDLLRECLAGRALEDVKAYLDQMRAQNMVLTFPREQRAEFEVQVNSVVGDTYVITEYFRDVSRVERYQNGQLAEVLEGDGYEKAIRATVVFNGDVPQITEVAIVADPNDENL